LRLASASNGLRLYRSIHVLGGIFAVAPLVLAFFRFRALRFFGQQQALDALTPTQNCAPRSADGVKFGATLFANGEGSRCVSDGRGREAFAEAVRTDPSLSVAERDMLIAARKGLASGCAADRATNAPDMIESLSLNAALSPSVRDFANYLAGAKAPTGVVRR
jgi:hypothetical protein